jgi:hypothetical protein
MVVAYPQGVLEEEEIPLDADDTSGARMRA